VQVKSGRSGQTVGNGTATVMAIAITFSRFRRSPGNEERCRWLS
jgi:hypothetical protein